MLAPGVGTDRRWNGILDELTNEIGLITCETVPTFRAGGRRSDLRLSSLPAGESAYYGGGQRVWPLRCVGCTNAEVASPHLIAPVILKGTEVAGYSNRV
jgi:hypothetical protein